MKQVPLDDLPKHSEWAAYLLDSSRDPPGELTAYTRTETYEKIYTDLLKSYRERPVPAADVVERIRSTGRSNPGLVSKDQRLYLVEQDELVEREYEVIRTALEPLLDGDETILDLGCGWGWTLDAISAGFPDVRIVGGEYVPAGVELAREVFADRNDRIAVEQFDFFSEWGVIDDVDGDCVVFTKGALITLPETEPVVERLETLAADGSVTRGIHLEQVGPHPETVIGYLRRQYSRERGYSDDVLEQFRESPTLDTTDVTYDVHGSNPLHPLTRIRWRAK